MKITEIIEKLGPDFPYTIENGEVICSFADHTNLIAIYKICNNLSSEDASLYLNEIREIKENISIMKTSGMKGADYLEYKNEMNQKLFDTYVKKTDIMKQSAHDHLILDVLDEIGRNGTFL